jgi:hypothetical protein
MTAEERKVLAAFYRALDILKKTPMYDYTILGRKLPGREHCLALRNLRDAYIAVKKMIA